MAWTKIWLSTILLLMAGLTLNETLLRLADHKPSLVSDADLFCLSYNRLSTLTADDVVLLGASRMQADFDLDMFNQRFPKHQILQLAQSGLGTAYPVFKDIVENSKFAGILLIDETESTLVSYAQDQVNFVQHCRHDFSIDRRINRLIGASLQSHFVFVNPESSSLRLWGNLITQRTLPEPFYSETRFDRSQELDFKRAVPQALQSLYKSRLDGVRDSLKQPRLEPSLWLTETLDWQPLVHKFQARGGRIVFIRMPVGKERWLTESKLFPPDLFWDKFVNTLNVSSVHFAHYKDLAQFDTPDTSHLDMRDRALFTNLLLDKLKGMVSSLQAESQISIQ